MEKDFEETLRYNFYSWGTARTYKSRIRSVYKRKGYTDLESFVRSEIQGKKVIYVPKKSITAFKKLVEFLAKEVKSFTGADIFYFQNMKEIIEVKEDKGII